MVTIFLGALLLSASAQAVELEVRAWRASCINSDSEKALDCGIPVAIDYPPIGHELPRSLLLPGEAKKAPAEIQDIVSGDLTLRYELRTFEVFPKVGPRYYQIQFEWIYPARSTCIMSVDAAKTAWPPLTCVAYDPKSGQNFGLLIQTK